MTQRYYLPEAQPQAPAELTGSEARHLIKVMRGKAGDEITLFDGRGAAYAATVDRVDRDSVQLSVGAAIASQRETQRRLTIGVALPKGDRQRWLIEKAVELGVTTIIPLKTVRGVAQPQEKVVERLRRAVIEASKQCHRDQLMEIRSPLAWADFLAAAPAAAARWLAHPHGQAWSSAGESEVWVGIGPEGGFSDQEVAQARAAKWDVVTLGPRILRVETAALAVAAALSLGD